VDPARVLTGFIITLSVGFTHGYYWAAPPGLHWQIPPESAISLLRCGLLANPLRLVRSASNDTGDPSVMPSLWICHCEAVRPQPNVSLRGAKRRGNLGFRTALHESRDCFAPLAMTGIWPPVTEGLLTGGEYSLV
jgi:hypothetical protein